MKEYAHPLVSPASNVIGLYQLGPRLKNLVYLSSDQLYEWALVAKSDALRALLIKYHVDRSQIAMLINEYLIDFQTLPLAANDDCYAIDQLVTPIPYQAVTGDSQVLDSVLAEEVKFAHDVKRLANLLPDFPGDLLLNIGFSCCELKAELLFLKNQKA